MAALTVQGGLGKNKMKGWVYNKPPYSRPPPLTCFFSIGKTLSVRYFLFTDTLSVNNCFPKTKSMKFDMLLKEDSKQSKKTLNFFKR